MTTIDPEGIFKSGQLRICSLCLGDIKRDDTCTYVDDEIACMRCAEMCEALALEDDGPLCGDGCMCDCEDDPA